MARAESLKRSLRATLLLAALTAVLAAPVERAHAVPYGIFNRAGDVWKVAETAHFRFYFTAQTQHSARRLLAIAEDTFARLNAFYGYRPPGKIGVTIVGFTAYSNGFADYSRNRITIFTTPLDFHSRSRVPWIEGVFTHELAHVLSLNTAASWFSRVPLVLGTGLSRSDTAQGLLHLPVYAGNWPHWFTEGVAQFDTAQLGRDGFDENRGAYQRALWEDRLLFPLSKIAFFGGEQWYNSGLSFLLFLEHEYGPGTVHRLFAAAGQQYDPVFETLFPRTLHRSLGDLEREFRADVAARYEAHRSEAAYGLYDGKPIAIEGQDEAYRDLTPAQREDLRDSYRALPLRYLDGKLFFIQGEGISYGEYSAETNSIEHVEALSAGTSVARNSDDSYFVLRPDGTSTSVLPYVYRPEFESQSLWLVDKDGDERLLERESRLSDMDVCAARSEMAAVYNDGDGSLRLALYALDKLGTADVALRGPARFPLPARELDEVRNPRYSADCRTLYFSRRIGRDHDLFALDLASGRVDTIAATDAFELYPEPSPRGLYYVSSAGGTMNVYLKPADGGPAQLITQALTGHHHPIATPHALVFARLYGTGFQLHAQRYDWTPPASALAGIALGPQKSEPPAPVLASASVIEQARGYHPLSPDDLMAPSIVPLLDLEYDVGDNGSPLALQGGLELYLEDQLSQHGLLLRGYAGNRNSFVLDYRNQMLPVTLRARAGITDSRSLYVYDPAGPQRFEHVSNYRWGFLWGGVSLPLSLFHTLTASAETTRDVGSTTGARTRPYDFADPRYGRELYGLRYDFSGIDRIDPTFRERDINKRGYRELGVGAYYGVEHVHPSLPQFDPSLKPGATPYFRAEADYVEYLALPSLAHGFFDHSLQLNLQLGYLSREVAFLPFMGGGQLYSLSAPEYNTSVGFVGYPFYSVRGETLINLGVSYRGPIARRLDWDLGALYVEDLYFQVFTSWGNIWSFDRDGKRQVPFRDRAANGRYVLGDVGVDLRIGNFFQEIETNVGATLRAVYRIVPFRDCPDHDPNADPHCLDIAGERGFMFYAIIGGGF
jgi:hypothetical protein